jgi:CO/xanthine dehydrogenase FAD-binding subunit
MKPPRFDYRAPRSLGEALDLLAAHGAEAKVLAGGQSLVPLLNFRLVRPAYLVDLNELPGLDGIGVEDGHLVIGAMTRQRAVETSSLVRERCPLLAEAMPQVGHVQIRNRGTVGGSLAHADPASELPAVVAALEGEMVLQSARGQRTVTAEQFFRGYLTTAAATDELLVEARIPVAPPRTGSAFVELSRRHGDFAIVGVAATVTVDAAGMCATCAIALTGVAGRPVVAREAARVLVGIPPAPDAIADVGRRVSEAVEPESDLHASSDYRKHLAAVLTRRALLRATARATGMFADAAGERQGRGDRR